MGFEIVAIAFVLLVVILIATGAKMVPQGYMYTVERFGKYTRTLEPGLHVIVPVIDGVGHKVNIMERVLDIIPQEVISADNAMVRTDAVCFFIVQDAVKASYEVNDLTTAMSNLVMTNIRAVLGSLTLDEALSKRDHINSKLLEKVDEATDPWGIKITRIEIRDISPPADLVASMAEQMKSERKKRSLILEAEGAREAAIQVAEGEKRAQILNAEGSLEAAIKEAEARERLAEAEAKATSVVSKAISEGDARAINYFVAQKYVEALRELGTSESSKVVMMPLEASSVIGSIAGIKELVTEVSENKR
ncbi:paraslipin [Endozoicomonas sp. (ex Bugula neritina AB1)]|nr:paraslipin [Endozoicomonas sp. (ex Bugula neritina AB1)]